MGKILTIPTEKQKKLMSQFGLVKEHDIKHGNPALFCEPHFPLK